MLSHLLLVDDNKNESLILKTVVERFFGKKLRITCVAGIEDAVDHLRSDPPNIVLLDFALAPFENCSETLPALRDAGYGGPLFVWSNHDSKEVVQYCPPEMAKNVIYKGDFRGLNVRRMLNDLVLPQAVVAA